MAQIHPTALVDPKAELAADVSVGPYAVIGPDVCIGEGSSIGAHCVIEGRTTIGRNNRIFQFCSLGAAPQDKKYAGEPTQLVIGDGNTIREFCTFNTGTVQDAGVTRIGDDNWIMAYVHVAHDCVLGSHIILANAVQLAGHVHLGDWVFLGGLSGVHQFVRVGPHAMTGFQTRLSQDLPPFVTAAGNPAEAQGINQEGLRRRGYTPERIAVVKQMHRTLYRRGLTLAQAKDELAALQGTAADAQADVRLMLDFLANAERGIVR
ncbi:acyl-ACP--UDP-N-acetylglucosamine O-acyltransferase [Caldimonas caldifontis]|uniref:Acyl-[acyl-carrier-protein]--UDP-N-acetylglucosamine O-acyltransferase n=1 Tax=Caldimonas caldifontis TaxID=1452508 RepID=A0A2S5SY44_9BURK|nr:acyl-ACP--UDP-N-acetylglucosamine O-acyltransferase [Caldimonas caldifontis]PPE67632.1 acyl-[acyl-carrier-protein]--UDP-N-acetylglucosamine O-acyltransferase [Caldimonas caldifontis]